MRLSAFAPTRARLRKDVSARKPIVEDATSIRISASDLPATGTTEGDGPCVTYRIQYHQECGQQGDLIAIASMKVIASKHSHFDVAPIIGIPSFGSD